MASTTFALTATIGILLLCAAFGGYATLGVGTKNGLLHALDQSSGYQAKEEKYFLGGPSPQKTTYTGIRLVDNHLVALNAFFVIILDGPATWDVTVVFWCLMAEVCAAWTFISIEGQRGRGNRHGGIVAW